jgi:hypothetical protein
MHDVGVMLASKYITGTAHIRRKLIDLIEATIDDLAAQERIPQITDHEIIRWRFGKWIELEIDSANPETFTFQAFHQVSTYETARTQDQS